MITIRAIDGNVWCIDGGKMSCRYGRLDTKLQCSIMDIPRAHNGESASSPALMEACNGSEELDGAWMDG